MPAMMRQQREIHDSLAPRLVVIRQILEHIALDLANMSIGIDHLPVSHLNLQLLASNSEIPLAKAQRRQVRKGIYFSKPLRLSAFAREIPTHPSAIISPNL